MPQLGEIIRGDKLGKTNSTRWHWYIWQACDTCSKERWVDLKNKTLLIPLFTKCHICANNTLEKKLKCSKGQKGKKGERSGAWKGGRFKDKYGYVMIYLSQDDFFFPMISKVGYVREHRLAMAKHINRCLLPWEVVHHKNGIKDDNRLENLELLPNNGRHNTQMDKMIKKLSRENDLLKKRIVELENAH